MLKTGSLINGRYRLQRELGVGGMAEVWLAEDEGLNCPVAIKVLLSKYVDDDKLLERLRREVRAVTKLNSDFIVQVYGDVSKDSTGRPFIVMEFVDGQTLREVLHEKTRLPVKQALRLLRDMAAGLAVAHQAGIIHRDLTPSNIMISKAGEVKITDFGIARDLTDSESRLTFPGKVWGTSHYMSPEQAQDLALSPACDIYALGILLFEMLRGEVPFPGSNAFTVAQSHIKEPLPYLGTSQPRIVVDLVDQMLAKAPEERPADGSVLEQRIETCLKAIIASETTTCHHTQALSTPDNSDATVRALIDAANDLVQQGNLTRALEFYRNAQALAAPTSPLSGALAQLVREQEAKTAKPALPSLSLPSSETIHSPMSGDVAKIIGRAIIGVILGAIGGGILGVIIGGALGLTEEGKELWAAGVIPGMTVGAAIGSGVGAILIAILRTAYLTKIDQKYYFWVPSVGLFIVFSIVFSLIISTSIESAIVGLVIGGILGVISSIIIHYNGINNIFIILKSNNFQSISIFLYIIISMIYNRNTNLNINKGYLFFSLFVFFWVITVAVISVIHSMLKIDLAQTKK